MINVIPIKSFECSQWLLTKHYAKRLCPISYAFGAYRDGALIGVVTFGMPSSSNLRNGICGTEYAKRVLELNRLCCENEKNVASQLVGAALRLLPKPLIIVSYADIGQGHVGYIYQATNFIYTGLSAKRKDWTLKGREKSHSQSIADLSKDQPQRVKWMRETYGDDFSLKERSRKHRYIYFCANKRDKQLMLAALKYPIEPYPKGDSKHYDTGQPVETQRLLFT